MHYLLEIILPNDTKDIKKAIDQTMEPFSEHEESNYNAFWDFYTIGGRFAGQKLIDTFDEERLNKFYEILNENKVTVSSFTCGKQEIKPADQIPFVDETWNDLFPENDGRPCPLFSHSNNQYDEYGIICGDIMPVKECLEFNCEHVIIATYQDYCGSFRAEFMLQVSLWNGVNFQGTNWDGKIGRAVEMFLDRTKTYNDEYKKRFENIYNWLSVTVDYHS